jgi:hypothetical protein
VTVAVRVSATVTGHRRRGVREQDLVLALPPGEVTARQLIEAAVAAELTAFQARAEEASMVRVFTKKSLEADLAYGAVRTGGQGTGGQGDEPGAPAGEAGHANLAGAVDAALVAFGDGLFKVFVGERELVDDGAALPVADGTALLFLRLVPLAGG